MKVIVYYDGGQHELRAIHPNWKMRREDQSEQEFLAWVLSENIRTRAQKNRKGEVVDPHLDSTTPVAIIDESELPAFGDRRAFEIRNGALVRRV